MIDGNVMQFLFGRPATLPVAVGACIGLVISALCLVGGRYISSIKKMEQEFSFLIGYQGVMDCFTLALFSSVAEELFFRGAVQHLLGIVGSAIVFGLLHWPIYPNLKSWPFFAFGMGIILGYEFELSGTILTPIATHFVVNFVNLNRISVHYKVNYEKYESQRRF